MTQSSTDQYFDITIIGGGPVGLFTAFYGGMRQLSVKVIDSMPQLGGQLSALYPEKFIYDVPGFPEVRAQELVDSLTSQAMQFNPEIVLKECVVHTEKTTEGFKIQTDKSVHYSKTIIITAGAGAFEPRKLTAESAGQFENENIHYFVSDLNKFKDKRVIVNGGGDAAVDWALMLVPIAKEVTLIHRRDKFRAHEHSVSLLKESSVKVRTPYQIKELNGTDELHSVTITNTKTGDEEVLPADELIVNFGFVSSLGPIKSWELEFEKGSIVVNSKMETNIPGIYAAGDVCTYPGKVKLIAVGFGEAPTAVNNAKAYMDPNARVQPLHSTSMDLSKATVKV